jgi:beta-lactamase class A
MPDYQVYRTLPSRRPQPASKSPQPASSHNQRFKKLALMSLSLLLITSTISTGLSVRTNQHAAAEVAWRLHQKAKFASDVQKIIDANPLIKFSVSAAPVSTDQVQLIGVDGPLNAASTAKVLTAIFYVKQVEAGHLSLNQTIGGKTAKRQLKLMLQQSDDSAWVTLNEALGHSNLEQYANSIGLNSYRAATNSISSVDLSTLLKDLVAGRLLNSADTDRLLAYMQNTNYEDFISPAVPGGYQIYHKVGIDEDCLNDTAIIVSPDGRAFVLTIMTNGQGLYQWPERAQLMQQIAAGAIKAYLQ